MGAVTKSVPSAVAPSAANTVPVTTEPQRNPRTSPSGSERIPVVPRSDELNGENVNPQPGYGGMPAGTVHVHGSGNAGAPSVPSVGLIFQAGPIDEHYTQEYEDLNPYYRVNQPPTRGMWTRLQDFANHIFSGKQNVDQAGWQVRVEQQRTSHMRNTLPPRGMGYAPATSAPIQMPQRDNTYKYMPATGTDPYGSGVLNSDTFGAGQTAGGIGGNTYTPTPGPPPTNSTAGNPPNVSGMPTWG